MRNTRRVLVVLVVLAGLVLVVDRVAAWAAQQTVEERVAQELESYEVQSAPPEVSFGGFPFLTQVAAGTYDEVVLRLRDVGSDELRLPLVELTASGVDAPARTLIESGPIHAASVTGAATIGYAQVTGLTGRPDLELTATAGQLAVRVPVEVLGTPVTLVGTADVQVVDGVVQVRVTDLSAEGAALPAGAEPVLAEVVQDLSVDVALPPLPYGLSVESVRVDRTGLVVTVTAVDVPLSR
jgi:hypothetical protein